MPIRPSKIALYDQLVKDLATHRGFVGIDASAAQMNNRHFFKTDTYLGIDIVKKKLLAGLARYPETVALLADLNTLKLPANCADVFVSTNTLQYIKPSTLTSVLKMFINTTKPDGWLFITMKKNSETKVLIHFLRQHFSMVDVIYWQNYVSQAVEFFLSDSGVLKNSPLLRSKWTSAIAFAFSKLERLTRRMGWANNYIYCRCHEKVEKGPSGSIDFDRYKNLGEGLYEDPAPSSKFPHDQNLGR